MEKRREFIKKISGLTAGIMIPATSISLGKNYSSDKWGDLLPKRKLGKTGIEVTMLGVGGYHIGWTTEKNAQKVIETALEGGVRFFDTAESYGPHTSEIRYGQYLTPKYRDEIFLMTKSKAQDAKTMHKHLDASLKRMKTEYLDLWQVHSIADANDVDERMQNGVFEVLMKAKEQGKVKYVGVTGHQNPAAHLRALGKTASDPLFDTIQMPINVVDANHDHFINSVLPIAAERQMGVLAMKTMADGRFFGEKLKLDNVQWQSTDPIIPDQISIKEALHFVWSLPVSVLITGAENAGFMKEKIELAKEFVKLDKPAREKLVTKVTSQAQQGKVEYYKNIS